MQNRKLNLIGVGGFARSGKDTFVKIANKILKDKGYTVAKLAFADALKNDLDLFLKEKYNISAWTDNNDEKALVRPIMVAHGCGKRNQSGGKHWVDKIDKKLQELSEIKDECVVYFISDCRFPNEVKWLHDNWDGWFVHLKKYKIENRYDEDEGKIDAFPIFDKAPNEEEAVQDPLIQKEADIRLELEDVVYRELKKGVKITPDELADDDYLIEEIRLCLMKCPFLNLIQT